ncbi:MAG TPA: class I SAM-dependent methyltransferase [Bryobacteraceae bacterium]|jgi:SAM-dependent methyltransferase
MSEALFDASGYAKWRPAVHPRVVDRVATRLGRRFQRALDVGCGAGLSTRPLDRLAEQSIGIEPFEPMLPWARTTAPNAHFAVGRAESLPVRSGSIDVMTAAGSLNYSDLPRALAEALRVLTKDGVLVVYDFSQGRSFRGSDALDEWFRLFMSRYPPAGDDAIDVSPRILAERNGGFQLRHHEAFEIGLTLSPEFYLEYALTETNVTHAMRNGVPREEIRSWCRENLRDVFQGADREVLFRGYIAYLFAS